MTATYLPEDCIYDILKHLENHHSTLFNCLLVNRFWCKITVPLLYADPFKFDVFYDNIIDSIPENYSSIISTLISCFSKEEILQLENQLKLIHIDHKIDINEHKPLFEYPKYLENFDHDKISTGIFYWLDSIWHGKELYDNFVTTFYHSILHRIISIKQLNISLDLLKIWNVQTNSTKLISLKLNLGVKNDKIALEFLSIIANNCLNLRKLKIVHERYYYNAPMDDPINEKLCTIIQKQNNLKAIILSTKFTFDDWSERSSPCYYHLSFINDVFLSLEFQKHSLIYIEFKDVEFNSVSFKNFINLCNLKCLVFNGRDCMQTIPLDQHETLKYASFKLKKLEFKCKMNEDWNNEPTTSLMIKHLGASLQELILFDEPNISIIENILTYCLNLIKLEIRIEPDIGLLIFPYFKNLKIRILNIIVHYGWDANNTLSEAFKSLASNLPTNVKEVSFDFYYVFDRISCFRIFLENCHFYLEVINFKNYKNYSIELGILEIILNYIERSNNSLKVLSIMTLEKVLKVLDYKRLELLNQIKTKGVKIVDFNHNNNL